MWAKDEKRKQGYLRGLGHDAITTEVLFVLTTQPWLPRDMDWKTGLYSSILGLGLVVTTGSHWA